MAFNFEVNEVAINSTSKTVENLGKSIKLQDKIVEIDSNGQEIVTADSEYDGLGKVTINTDVPTKPEEVLTETITENGLKTFNPTSGSVFSSASITVNVPEKKIEAEKTVNITENKETVITPTPDNAGIAKVVVTTNVPQPTLEENKTQTISANSVVEVTPSSGNDGMKKATITVNVPEKKIEANKTQSIVTNGETVITPTAGNDGMAKVTVNVNVPSSGSEYRTSTGVAFPKFLTLDKAGQENIIDNLVIDTNNISELFYSAISHSSSELKTDLSFDFSNITDASYFLGIGAGNSSISGSNTVTINNINQRLIADCMFRALPAYKIVLNGSGSIYGGFLCSQSEIVEFSAPNIYFEYAGNMFSNCSKLTTVSNLAIGGSARSLFAGTGLTTTPEIIVKTEVDTTQMFDSNSIQTIKKVTFEQGGSFSYISFEDGVVTIEGFVGLNGDSNFRKCQNLSNESVTNIITNAADLTGSSSKTLTFHSNVFATITEEQTAAATAKGWTLASA